MKAVKVVKAIAGMFFVCVAYSCNTGLGPEIDLIAPRLSLSSPALKEIVGDAFPVSGTVSDRGGVTLLSITMGSEKLVGDALVYTPLTGEWRNTLGVWQKKINGEWQTYDSGENQWNVDGERVSWRVLIDVTEADNGSKPQDGEYTITIEVIDGNQNKNADSVQKVKVVYDNQYPQLAVINPPLKPLKNGAVEEAPDFGYTLRDASCLDKLLNGSFELGYQIDDDFLNEGRLTIQFTNAWTDEADKIVYYELDTSTTRRGTITIEESELNHVDASVDMTPMQVRTVLRDDAGNTEEKNHGWFVWCPKADIPWVTLPIANGDSLYVNDVKTGQVFDDDGANNTVEYKIYVYDTQSAAAGSDVDTSKGKEWKEWKDPGYKKPDITNGAWSFTAPNEPGKYYIEVKCNDESGTPGDTVLAWWEVEDVANPQIESFEAAPSILGDLGTGNIVLKGVANDDAGIDAVKIVWIDPAVPNAAAVSVSFIDSGNSGWDTQGASYKLWSVSDTDMNPIADAGGRKRCEFSYPVNIFKELLVDGTTRKMHNQTFFVMAEDTNGNKKVSKFVFPGDTEAPVVTVTELVVDKNRYQLPHPQVIAAIDQNHKVTIKGTWGDNSWRDPAKFKDLSVTWNGTPLKVASFLGDGTWETETGTINNETSAVNITQTGAPVQTGGLVNIGASLADYGGNIGEGTASVTVESNDPMLFFISADQPNGVYAPGGVIDIFLEFNTVVVYSGNTGSVKLKLNTGGYAAYDASKNAAGGSRKHYFKYTVAQGDNLGSLTIDKIEGTAANEWKSVNGIVVVNMGSAIADLSSSSSSNVSNLKDKKSIKLDSVTPGITSFSTTSAEKDYGVGDVVFINATFSEPVTVLNGAAIKLTLNVANGYAGYESSSQDVVRFSYTVRAGDNTATLAVTGIENDGGASGIIKDAAGNKFSIPAGFSGGGGAIGKTIVIDTTQPGKPEVAVSVGGVAYSSSPPAELYANPLTIQAKKIEKAGTIVEYSTDAASANPIWQRYTGALMPTSGDNTYQADVIRTIAAYGAYKIAVRQTDSAGNQSQPSDIIDINMVKPDFLTRIGTINGSGEYSSERLPSIDITLSFNKPVAFPGGVSTELTLNATDTKGVKVKAINTSSSASTGTSFVFRYQAKAGDKTPGSEPLKVIAIGTGNTIFGVKIVQSSGGVDVSQYITLPAGNCLEDNADIRIIAGKPVFASPPPTAINSTNGPSYGGGNADFIIVFDRTISSGQGYIVFTPGEAEYRIPAVLPEARYKALFDNVRPDGFPGTTLPNGADFYEPTVNGADPSYAPDTSAKYVLKFQYDITDPGLGTLKEYMRRKEAVKVPAYSTKVSGGRLTVPLRDSYALPVKGVSYT
ncbi:MAG: hypothetical protein LBB48_08940, partial [Treponema sp.]|nr:hypothetical protein [Treponema sp.]